MFKKYICAFIVFGMCSILSGCYDMVDIEDIQSVAAVCVDNGSISYCTVSASPSEKKYSFDVYRVDGENLYHGLAAVSERTGKEISMSHLEAVMFSSQCSHSVVKENMNMLLGRTNSHPKAVTAYYDGKADDFLDGITVSPKYGFAKQLRQVLENRFSKNTICTAMDLCYALNFDGAGATVPLIALEDGDITFNGAVFVNNTGTLHLEKPYSDIIAALHNPGSSVYIGREQAVEIKCTGFDILYNREINSADVVGEFECVGFGADKNRETAGKVINDSVNYLMSVREYGFDVLDIYSHIRKSFFTIPSFERYVSSQGGASECVQRVKVDVKTNIIGDDK